jgi:hypothetical protein
MATDERPDMTMTDIALRMKEAFEDKKAADLVQLFTPKATINVDGKMQDVPETAEFLQVFFAAVDQTYLDIVAVERIDKHDVRPFVVYLMDVAWVDRESWKESVHKFRVALDLERDPKTKRHLIRGLTAASVRPREEPAGAAAGAFPPEVRTAKDGDPFSIWY